MLYERIQEYCADEEITISEFEKRCKIGNGTVGKWKDDKVKPTIQTLNKISKWTGVSLGYWLNV
jgi:transcriptional regulator with XRE-family HTH domain